jgi:Domain of unknown function (DUF1338)
MAISLLHIFLSILSFSLVLSLQKSANRTLLIKETANDEFLAALIDRLWLLYSARVRHVQYTERILNDMIMDHIAFRSIGGIHKIAPIFEALGYEARGCYNFPEKHLTAIHYEHRSNDQMPKLFISELKAHELDLEARNLIRGALKSQHNDLSMEILATLREHPTPDLLEVLVDYFETLPWDPPSQQKVEDLNQYSQYASWVLAYGYRVNHFAILVSPPETLESLQTKLVHAGIPMKSSIEGVIGSKLRQTATEAVVSVIEVVGNDGSLTNMEWPYAYLEFAERNLVDGTRFEGFLGPQATELFEMTKQKEVIEQREDEL